MGLSLRKPVAVNNWQSLTEEAQRLQSSGTDLLNKAKMGLTSLDSRMRIVKSQTLMIRLMLLNQAQNSETRQALIHTWWDSMESIFSEFQIYQRHTLDRVLEEPLLS